MIIRANDPNRKSWLNVPEGSDFSMQNLPFGIFKAHGNHPRVGVAIGDSIIDVAELNKNFLLNDLSISQNVLEAEYLNELIALGKETTRELRNRISDLLMEGNKELAEHDEIHERIIIPMKDATMMLPVLAGDYTDFYSSIEHATNVGKMFRDPDNALLPNWKHLPVGYHGRSSSIVVSGTPFHRPKGQTKAPDADSPSFGPSKFLDFELEMAFVTGKETQLGESVPVNQADEYIFGLALFNDWSARDIQRWEYVPLGPFLAKNFASSISPWIVTLDALEPFRVKGPDQDPEVLPYLKSEGNKNYDIHLEAFIKPENGEETKLCSTNFRYMYWNMNQQLAHHTVNGCNIRVGDIMASGTISGTTPDSFGSLLEITWGGKNPVKLADGSERKSIQDNDTLILRGYAEKNGVRIGLGEVSGKVLPAT